MVDSLTKMVYYELVKVIIDAQRLVEVIIDVVIRHHSLPDSIINDRRAIFIFKFRSSLCYFFGIKPQLSIAFYLKTDGKTERQNSIIEAYLRAFVNWEQNDWARLLPMAEFVYNNSKNASIGHTLFELNCGYHPYFFFEDKCNTHFRSFSAKGLAMELIKLMNVYCQNFLHAQEL